MYLMYINVYIYGCDYCFGDAYEESETPFDSSPKTSPGSKGASLREGLGTPSAWTCDNEPLLILWDSFTTRYDRQNRMWSQHVRWYN